MDISEIGQHLNVKTVLEGTVRKSGARLRVTAQLVNSGDGAQMWSERYDRGEGDVFDIQEEIAAAIVKNLKGTLGLPPGVRQPVKTLFAVRCKMLDRQDEFTAHCSAVGKAEAGSAGEQPAKE